MTSTFLHEDKVVPPGEGDELAAPVCGQCGQSMPILRVETQLSDAGTQSIRQYECVRCGTKVTERTVRQKIIPLADGSIGLQH